MQGTIKEYKKELDSIYKDYISPCVNEKEPLFPDWSIPQGENQENYHHPPIGALNEERCSKESLNRLLEKPEYSSYFDTSTFNCNYSTRLEPNVSDFEQKWLFYYKNPETKFKWYANSERSLLKPICDKVSKINNAKYAFFGNPKFYKEWNGVKGYMGWHTNHSQSPRYKVEPKLERVYFVYNTQEGSYFRYRDPENGEFITINEPKGWSMNVFKIKNNPPYFWHCLYSSDVRFSIGLRELYEYELPFWTNVSFPE